MITPTTSFIKDGNRTVKLNSYVVTLCRKDGAEVMAIRSEYFQNKTDVHLACLEQYPDWNVKTISRLYDEDFQP